jgi:hypothetical protein
MGWSEQTAAQMLRVYAAQDPNRAREILAKLEEHQLRRIREELPDTPLIGNDDR